jgi:hypothetical protein
MQVACQFDGFVSLLARRIGMVRHAFPPIFVMATSFEKHDLSRPVSDGPEDLVSNFLRTISYRDRRLSR